MTIRPFVPIKVRYLKLQKDDNIQHQAQVGHVYEQIIVESFNSPQSLFDEIEFPLSFRCQGRPSHGQKHWLHWVVSRLSRDVGLR